MHYKNMLLAAAVLALGACATQETQTAAAPSGNDCFRSDAVVHYTPVDRNTINVETSRANYVVTVGNAGGLDTARDPIVLRSANGQICTGNGLGVELWVGEPPRQLHVQQIARGAPMGS